MTPSCTNNIAKKWKSAVSHKKFIWILLFAFVELTKKNIFEGVIHDYDLFFAVWMNIKKYT